MEFFQILGKVFILFMLVMLGYLIRKKEVVSKAFDSDLTVFVLNITNPCLIIVSMQYKFSPSMLRESITLVMLSLLLFAVSFGISVIINKCIKGQRAYKNMITFMLMFSNCGFMGFPIISLVFGNKGVFYTAIFNLTFNFVIWSIGIFIIARGENKKFKIEKEHIINAGTVATTVGFVLFMCSIKLPSFLQGGLKLLGDATIPLSMICVGCILSKNSIINGFKDVRMYILSLSRLVITPAIFLLILLPFKLSPVEFGIPVIIAGMPAAANGALFAEKFGGDSVAASQGVFITTMFSVISIPGLIYTLQRFI